MLSRASGPAQKQNRSEKRQPRFRPRSEKVNAMPAVKFRVLLVDDEDDFRETLLVRLKNRGFEVTGASSGRKALDVLQGQDFDVIVLDVLMPEMDGLDCLKQIRQIKPTVGVILLTGHASVQSGIEGLHMGALEYLTKPVPLDELLEKLELAYERKRTLEKRSLA